MGDITSNFSYYEFRPKGDLKTWKPSSDYQKLLVETMANNLQVIRDEMPPGSYMKITSGVRTLSDYDRLIGLGYRPSKTSDHNCGVSIPLQPGTRKFMKFGETYNFSVGASDVVPNGIGVWELFKLSFKLTKEGACDFGQIIYERNQANGSEWVHYGNSLKELFSDKIIKMISRHQFMKSMDGGKTYSLVNNI